MLFVAVLCSYRATGGGWGLFLLLFLWPDLAILGYLMNVRFGAGLYNLFHLAAAPVLLGVVSVAIHQRSVLSFALIWFAHINWDRAFGYGLKYPTFFKDTHLQRVSPAAAYESAKAVA